MKIFVVGTGRVAKCVIDKLTEKGHTICMRFSSP